MTWLEEFEIPPKPGLQFGLCVIFGRIFEALSFETPYPSPFHIYHHHLTHQYQSESISLVSLSLQHFLFLGYRYSVSMKGGRSKVETRKADAKLSVKKGAAAGGKKTAKKGKPAKDPNKPKRPASAFFVFMEDFRKTYKEKHPNNKSVAAVGKAGGDKWKSLSDAEKAPFIAKAEKRKVEYEKTLQAYNKRMSDGPGAEEESDKSRSEVNDDEDDDEDGSAEDDDDDDDDE